MGDGVASRGDVDGLADAVARADEHDGPVHICLLPGDHRVDGTVVLRRSEVTIVGCGRQAPVTSAQGGVLRIERATAVRLERLALSAASADPTVLGVGVQDLVIEGCEVVNAGGDRAAVRLEVFLAAREPEGEAAGITTRSRAFRAREREEGDAPGGPAVVATAARTVVVRDCRLAGLPALGFQGRELSCTDNLMDGGVVLVDGTDTVEVRDNVIGNSPEMGVQLGQAETGGDERGRRISGAFTTERMVLDRGSGVGIAGVRITGNLIQGCGRGGVGTALLPGRAGTPEVADLVITDNRITACGSAPLLEGLAFGGGVLLQQASDVVIARNLIADNGPRDVQRGFAFAAGVAVYDCHGLTVRDNRIVDNGSQGGQETTVGAVGVVGAMVAAGEPPDDERGVPTDRPAATVEGNEIRVAGGPGVVLFGVGPMAVSHNHLVSRYDVTTMSLAFGRALMIGNLGAGSDTGFGLGARQFRSPVLHGPVRLHGNHVLVEDLTGRLAEVSPELASGDALAVQLLAGSAVIVFGHDDLSLQDNQVANRTGDDTTRIAASVWALGATLRASGNRFDETAGAALFSYAGQGDAAHVVTANVATHCLRVDGSRQAVSDNIELMCRRLQPFEYLVAVLRD